MTQTAHVSLCIGYWMEVKSFETKSPGSREWKLSIDDLPIIQSDFASTLEIIE